MRVGFISALYPPITIGGAELMTAQLAEGLLAQSIEVSVLSLQSPHDNLPDNTSIQRVPLNNVYWPYERSQPLPSALQRLVWHVVDTSNPWMKQQVAQWAKEQKLDLISTHNLQGFSTGIWPTLESLKIPIVHVLHDFALLCPRTVLFKNGQVCGLQERRCTECRWLTAPRARHSKSVSAVVGVSQFILQLHREHGLFNDIPGHVIYNALSDAQLAQTPPPFKPQKPLRLGFLGRLDRAKGLDVLLRAAEILRQKSLPVQWVLAGRGQPDEIKQWQAEYPALDIQWRGHIRPETLWPDIDALVFPSNSFEALGNVILEAGAAGRASIASRHGGAVELIDEGLSGALFQPGNPDDLAAVIHDLHQQPGSWQALGRQAYEKSRTFTTQRRTQAFANLCKDVLDAHRERD